MSQAELRVYNEYMVYRRTTFAPSPRLLKRAGVFALFLLFHFVEPSRGDILITTYLAKYNYLPQSDLETNQLRSSEEIEQAVKDLQYMGGLPETGHLDRQTVNLIQTPRCGLEDNVALLRARDRKIQRRHPASAAEQASARRRMRRFARTDTRWLKSTLKWTVTHYSKDLTNDQVRRTLSTALNTWGAVVPLTFEEVAPDPNTKSSHADIRIAFVDRYHSDGHPFDGKGGTLAHAFYPGDDEGGDTHFDNDETWVASYTDEGVHLPYVAVHELGHALGLMHTSVPGSIMYPWYRKPRDNDIVSLGPDDIDGITSIYGVARGVSRTVPPIPSRPPPAVVTTTRRPVTWERPAIIPTASTFKPQRVPTPPTDGSSLQCSSKFDAITIIRGEVMSFKGQFMWRMRRDSGPTHTRPINISAFFIGLPPPNTWQNIDEVFEQANDEIVFFIGKRYFVFDGTRLKAGFPASGRPITDYGLPASLDRVDAVFRWGLNGMMYIISGRMYWKYDKKENRMFPDYPRDMSMWKGVPLPVDAAFQSYNGKTYFFSGLQYWEYDDQRMSVASGYPKWSNTRWLGCPPQQFQMEVEGSSSGAALVFWDQRTIFFITLSLMLGRSGFYVSR